MGSGKGRQDVRFRTPVVGVRVEGEVLRLGCKDNDAGGMAVGYVLQPKLVPDKHGKVKREKKTPKSMQRMQETDHKSRIANETTGHPVEQNKLRAAMG